MAKNNCYTRLTVATAQALADLGCADLAVYLPRAAQGEAVLYRQAGTGLARPDYQRLREHGVSTLFVRTDVLHDHEAYLEKHLEDVLQHSALEPVAKAEIVHQVGQSIAQDLIRDPKESVSLERTTEFVDEIVQCVLADPSVAPYLAYMSSHHRSTAGHMVIVSMLAIMLGARVLGEDHEALRDLGLAGMLHDIGKLAIDPAILNKPGRLSPEEIMLVQQHPIEAVRLLRDHPQATPGVCKMIIQHHERMDGRGYPLGLKGDELDASTKILTLVDSFHAITGPRAYRASLTPLETNRVLNALAGRQFDPELLACWRDLFEERGIRPPDEWAVRGGEHAEDELAPEHEHRPSDARRAVMRCRPPRTVFNGDVRTVCVYSGRLEGVTSAPDRFECLVRDLSRFGMGLHSDHPLFRGEVLHVLVKCAGRPIWLESVVAWCRQQDQGRGYCCGVRFTSRLGEDQVGRPSGVEGMGRTTVRTA
ncbi:MAG TPA: HD domain-containing phosphohydrolase [Phycisphaerae bacterium]|nr:HD domain-containing phosphohydrolase [Phycisphaerae bacterium]